MDLLLNIVYLYCCKHCTGTHRAIVIIFILLFLRLLPFRDSQARAPVGTSTVPLLVSGGAGPLLFLPARHIITALAVRTPSRSIVLDIIHVMPLYRLRGTNLDILKGRKQADIAIQQSI